MHRLLFAIKDRLGRDEGLLSHTGKNPFRGENRIFILSGDDEVPAHAEYPHIQLIPGGETVLEEAAGQLRIERQVILRLAQEVKKDDINISSETHKNFSKSTLFPSVNTFSGPTAAVRLGVLELAKEVVRTLEQFRFLQQDLDYDFATYTGTDEPVLLGEDVPFAITADIHLRYTLWRNVGELK